VRLLLRGVVTALCLAPIALVALASRRDAAASALEVRRPAVPRLPPQAATWPTSLDSVASHVVKRAPFRADRHPMLMRFQAQQIVGPSPPGRPRPALVLKGIIWSRDPVILVDGLPDNAPQRLFHVGDTLAGLQVRKISPTTAVIRGFDTTWVLSLQRPAP
jgi:hypothetical protein